MHAVALAFASGAGGLLLVISLVIPLAGVLLAFAVDGRKVELIAAWVMPLGFVIALAVFVTWGETRTPLVYLIGSWGPPLGLALRADGLSAVMMTVTAIVICAIGVYARVDFSVSLKTGELPRSSFAFWILLLTTWAALNTVFLGGDLFTLYVALELLTFAAVPMVCLDGRGETLQAAVRYLLFALLGSAFYLVGTALLYGVYGTLDIVLLSDRIRAQPTTLIAAALMTVGLLAKTALFPLHLWLPPAHAGAPAAGSAVLSALVIKGSFFLVVRIWFNVMPAVSSPAGMQLLAALGAAAIVLGSVVALRQERLKLLIAYSTLAQIGYLFLMFPLAFDSTFSRLQNGGALVGGMLQAISHATAKAAMFMTAGLIYAAVGHDRIDGLSGTARTVPIVVLIFALSGAALIGVPPSGAYLAKELFLQAAADTEQWWWAVVIQVGGILTSSYVLLVIGHAIPASTEPLRLRAPVSRLQAGAALALAICSLVLGIAGAQVYSEIPHDELSKSLSGVLWTILGGAVLAILMGRWGHQLTRLRVGKLLATMVRTARSAALIVSRMVELVDGTLREWPAAGLSLLLVVILFVASLMVGR
jgi:multicomponent Na+:H+ antiporter subunit D